MRLASASALLLLLLVPGLLVLRRWCQRPATIAYSAIQDLVALPPSPMTRLHRALPGLRAVVLGLCIVALARPQQGLEAMKTSSEGIAILMVVDVSSSMGALDLQLNGQQSNRLQVVKHTFRAFVRGGAHGLVGRAGDVIGQMTEFKGEFTVVVGPMGAQAEASIRPTDQEIAAEIGRLTECGVTGRRRMIAEASAAVRDDAALVWWVTRGSCWLAGGRYARKAWRGRGLPDFRNFGLGFRVVCVSPVP